MKRLIPIFLVLAMLLAACQTAPAVSTDPSETEPSETTEAAGQLQQLDMSAVSLPAAVETLTDNGKEIFSFTSQSISLVVPDPDVAEKIIINFGERQAQYRQAAETIHEIATEMYTGGEWTPYLYSALYDPMRVDENVMSLAGTIVSWSGGNHPNYNCAYANYDMVTGDVMTLGSILTHKDKAADLRDLLIEAIAQVQEQHSIWSDYEKIIRDRFAADISYDDAWYFDANGICFRFTPYEIAPYSSGIITVTVPYSKLTGIMEDAYFPTEKQPISGSMNAAVMDEAALSQLDQFAELELDMEGSRILLSTDSVLYDVSIKHLGNPDYTALRVATLTPGDAIMVQADFDNTNLMVEYIANNAVYRRYISVSGSAVELLVENPN